MRFTGAEQAVKFAHNIAAREIASRPSMVPTIHATSQEGLSPHELHAQAALILQALNRLPELERNAVNAVLAPDQEALQAARQAVEGLWPRVQSRVPSKNAAYDVLRLWLRRGAYSEVRKMCADYHVGPNKVVKWRSDVATAFSAVYLRGILLLEADLFRAGGLELKT